MLIKLKAYNYTLLWICLFPINLAADDSANDLCNVSIEGVSADHTIDEAESIWSARSYRLDKKNKAFRVKKGKADQILHFTISETPPHTKVSWGKAHVREGGVTLQRNTVSKSSSSHEPNTNNWRETKLHAILQEGVNYWCPNGSPRADFVTCDITDTGVNVSARLEFSTGDVFKCEYLLFTHAPRGTWVVSEHIIKSFRAD